MYVFYLIIVFVLKCIVSVCVCFVAPCMCVLVCIHALIVNVCFY